MPGGEIMPKVREDLQRLLQYLAFLPIDVQVSGDAVLIADCARFVTNAVRFWSTYRNQIPVIEEFSLILSHDYHHVTKPGLRELRLLLNIFGALSQEFERVSKLLKTDIPVDGIPIESLEALHIEAAGIQQRLNATVSSTIADLENSLLNLRKASGKLWNKHSVDSSVIPKGLYFFISHASKDKDLAVAITEELETMGITTWRDDKDIEGGDSIPSKIAQGLEKATHFGLLFTDISKDRNWVKTEFENALMLRERTGKTRIIPLLKDELTPPTILGNIKGIAFDDFSAGMEQLWRSLGIPSSARVSLDMVFKFQQMGGKALTQVKECRQYDSFLEVDESTFEALEDIESYARSFPIKGAREIPRRFEWTMVSWPVDRPEEVRPSFECEFYTNQRAAIAGSCLLRSIDGIANRLLDMLRSLDATPLPSSLTSGA